MIVVFSLFLFLGVFLRVHAAPRFLHLPFSNELNVLQGYWYYPMGSCVNPSIDEPCKHEGIDYQTGYGKDIFSAAAGTARRHSQYNPMNFGYGEYVFISHSNRYFTLYAHMSVTNLSLPYTQIRDTSQWAFIDVAQYIGKSGNSGTGDTGMTNAHLHFETRLDNYLGGDNRDRRDPYDIHSTSTPGIASLYPPNGAQFTSCGLDFLWTQCPPSPYSPMLPVPVMPHELISRGPTYVSESLFEDTTWFFERSPYVIQSNISITSGATLTIEPGVVVKFDRGASLNVSNNAYLFASAGLGDRIVFTSLLDDSIGGDTNGDGNATVPGNSDFVGIRIFENSFGYFDNTSFHYGGSFNPQPGIVKNLGGTVTFLRSSVSHSNYGLYQTNGSLVVDSSIIRDNTSYGLFATGGILSVSRTEFGGQTIADAYLTSLSGFSSFGNVNRGGGKQEFQIAAIFSDQSWVPGIPYLINGATVNADVILTLTSDTVIKFLPAGYFHIYGTMRVEDSPQGDVYVTSYSDDSIGGDTNGDGNATGPVRGGGYRGIYFWDGSVGDFQRTHFFYGGADTHLFYGALKNIGGSLTLNQSSVSHSYHAVNQSAGTFSAEATLFEDNVFDQLYFSGGDVSLIKNVFLNPDNQSQYDAYLSGLSSFVTIDNTSSGRGGFRTGSISYDQTWYRGVPFVIDSSSLVASTSQLTLAPGVVVKFLGSGKLSVFGSLVSEGTSAEPVYVTSYRDDSIGGDTNGDGSQSQPWYTQPVNATLSLNASNGVFHPSRFLGRLFSAFSTTLIASSSIVAKSVPFGKYQRISPLVFSLVPLSHEWYG
ncbi:MAG: hypothetical protein COU08_01410 [Candidatus Harrisonbacteria bacterium CG10_big_fil_rev_8_21_14_0_10_42_17]|uniref:M23ase beta-sheet core domain-containing protein n=1 Tax=Candidatus Harrisonbacteria bacterium CG10_big_fil_rev_8_21_14_0_10_42_17 TaxID=1974584 RepID=A0A2M6WIP2_9BACT|nr:MAG: hypothetical protein COU08_01410 [Candidatus Harrisonbacteria bacterium CG10_big_fil_rev_8_21_14_0_10_42_17]